jgi:hypothetical protein
MCTVGRRDTLRISPERLARKGGVKAAGTAGDVVEDLGDAAAPRPKLPKHTSDKPSASTRAGDPGSGDAAMPPPEGGGGSGGRKVHSKYADGTPVYEGEQPPRLGEPKPKPDNNGRLPEGEHSQLRWDEKNGRIYQAREFDQNGNPVRDVDFTSPTYPSGQSRPDHLPPPHQHRWHTDPKGGSPKRSRKPEPLE